MDGIDNQLARVVSEPVGAASQFARLRNVLDHACNSQSSLASDEVLGAILQTALTLTGAEHAYLILRSGDDLEIRLGRDRRGRALLGEDHSFSEPVILEALKGARQLVSVTLDGASRDVICVPLIGLANLRSQDGPTGLIYLDCPQQTVVPQLNLELLHTLALEASTVLESAAVLEHERQRLLLDQELELARKIQQNLLPREFPNDGWLRAAGSSLPSLEVSGDYFDLHRIDNDNWAAIIADVSGKGISSALLSSLLQGALLLGSDLDVSLDEVMRKINGFLVDRAQREKYATLFYATIHSSGVLEWVNAGHCAPYVINANGKLQQLQTTGMPLGLWRNARYAVERTQLGHGDKILAYSDGVSEAENTAGEAFEPHLVRILKHCGGLGAQQLHERVIAETLAFRDEVKQRDDITVLVLEYQGG